MDGDFVSEDSVEVKKKSNLIPKTSTLALLGIRDEVIELLKTKPVPVVIREIRAKHPELKIDRNSVYYEASRQSRLAKTATKGVIKSNLWRDSAVKTVMETLESIGKETKKLIRLEHKGRIDIMQLNRKWETQSKKQEFVSGLAETIKLFKPEEYVSQKPADSEAEIREFKYFVGEACRQMGVDFSALVKSAGLLQEDSRKKSKSSSDEPNDGTSGKE